MPPEDRREQLLLAAIDVIVERGFADTRITDVAERAGTSPALVIYYFKTRDSLLTEALRYSADSWYATGVKRLAEIRTAAGQLTEMIAMTCLSDPPDKPGNDPGERGQCRLRLDLWALSQRSPGAARVRQESDERWRQAIRDIVIAGQEAGEFARIDAGDFALTLSALLDGMAVQIALEDPGIPPVRAYDLALAFAARRLEFAPPAEALRMLRGARIVRPAQPRPSRSLASPYLRRPARALASGHGDLRTGARGVGRVVRVPDGARATAGGRA